MIPVPLVPRWLRYLGVTVVAALIFYGSLVTVPETVVDDTQPAAFEINHWRHLVAYFTLACSLAYATADWELPRWHNAALVIALAAAYGVAMELGQAALPHRTPFLLSDAIVNTIGASGILVWYWLQPYVEYYRLSELFERLTSPRS